MIVEDGTGVSGADSLASVDFADAHFESRGNTAWALLDDDVKSAALVSATDYLEGAFRQRWLGTRLQQAQALSWPRMRVYVDGERYETAYGRIQPSLTGLVVSYIDYVGYELPHNVVPLEVRKACADLAARIAIAAVELAPDLPSRTITVERVGAIQVHYAEHGRTMPGYPAILAMLKPLFRPGTGGGLMQLTRA